MATNDPWKRYFDAGVELTLLTRQRAEKVVRDLMKAGEVQREEAQDRVEELLERSRRSTEAVVELVRDEVAKQLRALGVTTRGSAGNKSAAKTSGGAKKSTANAAGATQAPAKKAAKKAASKSTGAAKKTVSAAKKATGTS